MDSLRPPQIIVAIATVVLLIASVLDQTKDGDNVWGNFGVLSLPVLLAIVITGLMAATVLGGVRLPQILTFAPQQLCVALALPAAMVSVGFLLTTLLSDLADTAVGTWLGAAGGIGLLIGTVLALQDAGATSTVHGAANPPTSF